MRRHSLQDKRITALRAIHIDVATLQRENVYIEDGALILEAKMLDAPLPNTAVISSGKVVSTPAYT
jgi:hypothetical protein